MANLASSAVTVNRRFKTVGCQDGNLVVVDATLVLTGQGGLTNKIPKGLFGLSTILEVSSVRGDDSTLYLGAPSYDGENVVLVTNQAANGTPADVTDTIRLLVSGKEQL